MKRPVQHALSDSDEMNARLVGREPPEKPATRPTAKGPPSPRFRLSTLHWVMLAVSLLAGFGFATELLVGTAWLAIGPILVGLLVLLQLPIAWLTLRRITRSQASNFVSDEPDARESDGPEIK